VQSPGGDGWPQAGHAREEGGTGEVGGASRGAAAGRRGREEEGV
jgi:hypothetical protein